MTKVNLLPDDSEKKAKRGEEKGKAMLELGAKHLLAIFTSIDDGTDSDSVKAEIYKYIESGEPIPAEWALDTFDNTYREIAAAYATIMAAMKLNENE